MAQKTIASQKLKELTDENASKPYTFECLIAQLGVNSYFLIILILSVPFLQPVPLPGLSTPIGLFMSVLGLGIMFNFVVPTPKFIKKKEIPQNLIQIIFKTLTFILNKFEFLIKPRFPQLAEHSAVHFLAGLLITISSLVLTMPLPPGMNFPPALVCFILSLGLLEKDIVLIILGVVVFALEATAVFALTDWLIGASTPLGLTAS